MARGDGKKDNTDKQFSLKGDNKNDLLGIDESSSESSSDLSHGPSGRRKKKKKTKKDININALSLAEGSIEESNPMEGPALKRTTEEFNFK